MKKIIQHLKGIRYRIFYYLCPDKIFLNHKFRETFGRNIDWKNPKTFNEKLQWLKIYDRNPFYSNLVDKYEVRKYISEKIGSKYLVPCIGIWEKVSDIDFDKLPDKFVLKCTHDSHSVVLCSDKSTFDVEKCKKFLKKRLNNNFYYNAREWPYKNVKPRIIAEEYLFDGCETLTDYKFFTFNGNPKIMYISNDIGTDPRTDFFDMDFNHLSIQMKDPPAEQMPNKPLLFEEMKRVAETLSEGYPHLRVDFYVVNDKLYVGELTFYHCSGFSKIYPEEWDEKLGEYLVLPHKK